MPAPARAGVARRIDWPLVAIVAAGGLPRFLTLGVQSYWYNEAATVFLVKHGLGSMLSTIPKMEGNPPLYYVLAWFWARLFGFGEVGLRSLSALAGTALIALLYTIANRMAGRRAGLVAAALTAANPLLFWFSQEARPYILLVVFVALGFHYFLLALEDGSPRRLSLWAVSSVLALATHYFAIFVVAPELAWLLWPSAGRRAAIAAGACVIAAGGALLPLALRQREAGAATSIVGGFGERIVELPKQLLVGYSGPLEKPLTGAVALLSLYGAYLALARSAGPARRGARVALVIGVAALAIVLAAAAVGLDYMNTRNLIELWLFATLVVAVGLGGRSGGARATALAACICALLVFDIAGVETDPVYQRDDWRGAVRALGSSGGVSALVVTPGQGFLPLLYYLPAAKILDQPTAVSEVDLLGIAIRSSSGVAPAPPRVPTQPPLPGLRLIAAVKNRMFTVARYRSARPLVASPALLRRLALSGGSVLVYSDPPRGGR